MVPGESKLSWFDLRSRKRGVDSSARTQRLGRNGKNGALGILEWSSQADCVIVSINFLIYSSREREEKAWRMIEFISKRRNKRLELERWSSEEIRIRRRSRCERRGDQKKRSVYLRNGVWFSDFADWRAGEHGARQSRINRACASSSAHVTPFVNSSIAGHNRQIIPKYKINYAVVPASVPTSLFSANLRIPL